MVTSKLNNYVKKVMIIKSVTKHLKQYRVWCVAIWTTASQCSYIVLVGSFSQRAVEIRDQTGLFLV